MSTLVENILKIMIMTAKSLIIFCIVFLGPGKTLAAETSFVEVLACLEGGREKCVEYKRIQEPYQKYRQLIGLYDYTKLKQLIKSGRQGYALGLNGKHYYFETQTPHGKNEFDQIKKRFAVDIKKKQGRALLNSYKKEMEDLEKNYPILLNLSSQEFYLKIDEILHDLKLLTGAQEGNDSVTERFFKKVQQRAVEKHSKKLTTMKAARECLKRNNCEITEELKQVYQEYRVYVGLLKFEEIKMRIKHVGRISVSASGTSVFYSTLNEKGDKELDYISKRYESDMNMIYKKLGFDEPQTTAEGKALKQVLEGRSTHYKELINRYVIQYPMLAYIKRHNPSSENIGSATEEVVSDYQKVVDDLKGLKGDELYELTGFVDILEETTKEFSKEENLLVSSYVYKMQNDTTSLERLKKRLSPTVIALTVCHVATYYLNVPIPIVQFGRLFLGAFCIAYGVGLTAGYMWNATVDLSRQVNYAVTGEYGDEVLNQFMKSYVSSLIMSVLYLGPALPGLLKRVKGIDRFGKISLRQYRKGRTWRKNLMRLKLKKTSSIKGDFKGLARAYSEYTGKDIAVSRFVNSSGKMLASASVIESAVAKAMREAFGQRLQIFNYAAFLKAI